MNASAKLRIGLAGWSYPDWRGTFYPAHPPSSGEGRFSELRFAARMFDCLEINNTFYRLPESGTAAAWVRQVEDIPGFSFTAKLHRSVTHGGVPRGEVPSVCRRFLEGLEPLREAERLGCVLVQFPWYFEDGPESRDLIRTIAESLQPCDVAVEVRHRSFLRRGDDGGLPFMGRLGLNFVNIDLPRSSNSPPLTCINTGPIGYFRLHGRNRSTWFDPQAGRDDKYDYLYSVEELRELLPLMVRLAQRTQVTYVVANNHFRAQAPANAIQLIQLSGREPPEFSENLMVEFPFLRETARGRAHP